MNQEERQRIIDEHIRCLDRYRWDDGLVAFDSLHLYPSDRCCAPSRFYDSRWMRVVGYNENTWTRKEIRAEADGLVINSNVQVREIRIYVDGSTFISFSSQVRTVPLQRVEIEKANPTKQSEENP